MYSLTKLPKTYDLYGFIYIITNCINNSVYIGQTIRSVNTRIGAHKKCLESNIGIAINKYGFENFKVSILYGAKTREELDSKEIEFISSYRKEYFLYNIANGGFGKESTICKKKYRFYYINDLDYIKKINPITLFYSYYLITDKGTKYFGSHMDLMKYLNYYPSSLRRQINSGRIKNMEVGFL